MPDSDDLLTVTQAAQLLGLTPLTIRRLIDRGSLPAEVPPTGTGRNTRLRRSEVLEWVEGQRVRPGDLATWYGWWGAKTQRAAGG